MASPSDAIEYRETHQVDKGALRSLRAACEFAAKDLDYLAEQVAGVRWLVHAYDGARLVGFCRAISDGVSSAYVSSVMVDPEHRRCGIGRELLARLTANRDQIKFVLHSRPDAAAFYAAVGFASATDMMIRNRADPGEHRPHTPPTSSNRLAEPSAPPKTAGSHRRRTLAAAVATGSEGSQRLRAPKSRASEGTDLYREVRMSVREGPTTIARSARHRLQGRACHCICTMAILECRRPARRSPVARARKNALEANDTAATFGRDRVLSRGSNGGLIAVRAER